MILKPRDEFFIFFGMSGIKCKKGKLKIIKWCLKWIPAFCVPFASWKISPDKVYMQVTASFSSTCLKRRFSKKFGSNGNWRFTIFLCFSVSPFFWRQKRQQLFSYFWAHRMLRGKRDFFVKKCEKRTRSHLLYENKLITNLFILCPVFQVRHGVNTDPPWL